MNDDDKSNKANFIHSRAVVDGFGHTTINGREGLCISISGGANTLEQYLLRLGIQGVIEYLTELRESVERGERGPKA